jgi:hypothetical protein
MRSVSVNRGRRMGYHGFIFIRCGFVWEMRHVIDERKVKKSMYCPFLF